MIWVISLRCGVAGFICLCLLNCVRIFNASRQKTRTKTLVIIYNKLFKRDSQRVAFSVQIEFCVYGAMV